MAYLLQVLTPPNTRLGDCLLPSAKEEVLGRPLMVTTLLLPLALAVYLSRSLALAHVHLLFPLFRFVSVLFLLFLLSILAILLPVIVVTFVLCPGTEDEHTTTKEDDEDRHEDDGDDDDETQLEDN